MSDHSHTEYVEGCFRCELSRDEVAGLDSSDWDFPKIITLDTPIVERLRTRAESWADGWELDALTDKEAADEIERLRALITEWDIAATGPQWDDPGDTETWYAACARYDAAGDALHKEARRG